MESRPQDLTTYSLSLFQMALQWIALYIYHFVFFPDYLWNQVQKGVTVGSKDKFPSIKGAWLHIPMSNAWDCPSTHSITHGVCYQTSVLLAMRWETGSQWDLNCAFLLLRLSWAFFHMFKGLCRVGGSPPRFPSVQIFSPFFYQDSHFNL